MRLHDAVVPHNCETQADTVPMLLERILGRIPRLAHDERVAIPRLGVDNRLREALHGGERVRHRTEHGRDRLLALLCVDRTGVGQSLKTGTQAVETAERARYANRSILLSTRESNNRQGHDVPGDICTDAEWTTAHSHERALATARAAGGHVAVVRVRRTAEDMVVCLAPLWTVLALAMTP